MGKTLDNTIEYAKKMDALDPLKAVRNKFYIEDDIIYMDGNSLGLFPKDSEACLLRVLNDYKKMGIDCWTKTDPQFFLYQDYLGELMAPLVGADPKEVTIHSNTTINIHTMIATFYKPTEKKYKILVDDLTFPTSRYAVESQIKLKGLSPESALKEVKSENGKELCEDRIIEAMTDDVAIVLLPSVLYRSGQLLNVEKLTKAAHHKDIIIGFDCCHGIGAVKHHLSKWGVDFAVWCTYKYLNGGPGASAALYINKKHFHLEPGLAGWHGYVKNKQFDLLNTFESSDYAGAWQTGTQNIFSMAPLEGSLKLFNEIGMEAIREKSLKLTAYMMFLTENVLSPYGFTIGNPKEDHRRGGHVALEHDEALRINEALKARGIIPDFRFPNVIRFAPIALYTSFEEVHKVIQVIKEIMDNKTYEAFSKERNVVA